MNLWVIIYRKLWKLWIWILLDYCIHDTDHMSYSRKPYLYLILPIFQNAGPLSKWFSSDIARESRWNNRPYRSGNACKRERHFQILHQKSHVIWTQSGLLFFFFTFLYRYGNMWKTASENNVVLAIHNMKLRSFTTGSLILLYLIE